MVDDDDNFNNREFIVDEMLGDVLLMQRETIQSHFQEVKQMKSDIRSLEEKIRIALEHCNRNIEDIQLEAKAYVDKEVLSWSKQYQDAGDEKKRLENELKEILKKVENKQLRAVDELESMYENKIKHE
jgi:hypothetical protein